MTACSGEEAVERAKRWSTTSVSLLVWKMEPFETRSRRISPALTMLPLWQIDIWPWTQSIRNGWALASRLSPAVE